MSPTIPVGRCHAPKNVQRPGPGLSSCLHTSQVRDVRHRTLHCKPVSGQLGQARAIRTCSVRGAGAASNMFELPSPNVQQRSSLPSRDWAGLQRAWSHAAYDKTLVLSKRSAARTPSSLAAAARTHPQLELQACSLHGCMGLLGQSNAPGR